MEKLLASLPPNIPKPDIDAEDDGSVTLNWFRSRRSMYSVSLMPSGKMAWALLNGAMSDHGVDDWDGERPPKKMLEHLQSMFQ